MAPKARSSPGYRATLAERGVAETFLVWAIRERSAGGAECPCLAKAFRRVFGLAEVEPALRDFDGVFVVLSCHLSRNLRLLPPCCGRLTRDEALLLQLFAAVQKGNAAYAANISNSLVGPVWASILCGRVDQFVLYLTRRSLKLPLHAVLTGASATDS